MALRINNFNFEFNLLTVHDGKGKKDRAIPLPENIEKELKAQVEEVESVRFMTIRHSSALSRMV